MKHPALARVLAIVLAVMCFVMIVAGVGGVRNAFTDKKSDDETLALLNERISSIEELQGLLAHTDSYTQQSTALEEAREQHESDSAQHRTDLATYSATRGGTKMGADKLWEAKAQTESGREQLEGAMQQLQAGEAAFAMYQSAQSLAGQSSSYVGELGTAMGILQSAAGQAAAETDPMTIAAIMGQAQTDAEAAMPNRSSYNDAKTASVTLLTQISAMAGTTFDSSMIPADISVTVNVNDMQATMTQIGTASAVLSNLGNGLTQFATSSGMDATTGATLAATRTQLEKALAQLKEGENTIQSNLEQIWYQNGELEKDAVDLEQRKGKLDAETQALSELEEAAETQKENERKYNSLSILLRKNGNISAAVAAGGELVESAKLEADRFAGELRQTFGMRLLICTISILSGIAGFVEIPAAFEKTKSRMMLIVPVLVCLLCAAVAVGLSVFLGRGPLYSAIFTIPFAAIQLAVILPQEARKAD